ncbi:MAG: MFS transporter [Oscillospiraceae bacterium]|nr:MFS transporter [Oscillospiraceae bacterium]MBR3973379.1 MFS transporter [Oscillospiraceae bacterium]
MRNMEKVKARESKELSRLQLLRSKPEPKNYVTWIFFLVILVHIIDEIASNCSAYVQSSVVTDFFVLGQGMTYENGLAVLASFSGITMLLQLVAPFYKSLADRFGRKPFLVINTYGMALGLVLCFLSSDFTAYIIGTMITTFFIAHDMQVVYILEVAPSDKRTRFYGMTKCIGSLGLALVPLFRSIFMGSDATKWRLVYLVPVIIALVIATICLLTARETSAYLNNRIAVLEKPLEDRIAEKKAAKEAKKRVNKVGFWATCGFLLRNKDTRWLVIAANLYMFSTMAMTGYYESIMTSNGMTTENVTTALFGFPFIFAFLLLICGFFGDSLGRKKTALIMGITSIISFALFVFACQNGWSPVIVGGLYGLYLGSYYQVGDYMWIMAAEKAPTENRASSTAAITMISYIGLFSGLILLTVMLSMNISISTSCMIVMIPTMVLSMFLLMSKVKETKGTDLESVGKESV